MKAMRLAVLGFCFVSAAASAMHTSDPRLDQKKHVDVSMMQHDSHMSMVVREPLRWEILRTLDMRGGRMGASGGLRSADFGTPTEATLFDVTFEVGRTVGDFDLSAALPIYYLKTENGVDDSDTGIGDLLLSVGHEFVSPPKDKGLFVSGDVSVKLPTADDDKDLGTGETDLGASATVGHRRDHGSVGVTLGYIWVGDPLGIDYRNRYVYSLFATHRLAPRWSGYVSLDGGRSQLPEFDDPLSLGLGAYRKLEGGYWLGIDTSFGLNDGADDFYVSVGVGKWF